MSRENNPDAQQRPLGRTVILAFHKVQPSFSYGATNFSPSRLKNLLTLLTRRGFRLVSLREAIESGDPKTLAVTFDDGYAHLSDTLPVLVQEFGFAPTVFIPTGYLGCDNSWDYSSVFHRTRHLDAAAIRDLAAAGVEFGAHGHRHIDLTKCNDKELRDELDRPMKILEDLVGAPIVSLSYPFGRTNGTVTAEASRAGYRYGLTMRFPKATDLPIATGRLPIYGYDTTLSILQKVEGGRLYALENLKSGITNRLSAGTSLWRRVTGR